MKEENLSSGPNTNPADLYRARDAMYAVDLLIVGLVHLDIFTRLSKQRASLQETCAALGLAERPADVMFTLFTAMGLLEETGGVFHVTDTAREHLVSGSRWHLGPYYASMKDRPVALDLLQVLKTGKPATWGSFKEERDWARAMESDDFAVRFTAAMDCRGATLGPALARTFDFRGSKRLLDVAGGSGIYACAIVSLHRHLSAMILEKPPVDAIARTMISRRGFEGRVSVAAGDMFSNPFPAGFDVHLFSNVLHDWDVPDVKRLLARSHEALEPGGAVVVHDAYLDRRKSGPLQVAEYSVLLMHSTEGRCYSVSEMETFLEEAGFEGVEHVPTAASRSIVTAKKG